VAAAPREGVSVADAQPEAVELAEAPGEAVPVVLTTHECEEAAMQAAMSRLAALDCVLEKPALIRIEAL
jgi:homoserine dehydrogenase